MRPIPTLICMLCALATAASAQSQYQVMRIPVELGGLDASVLDLTDAGEILFTTAQGAFVWGAAGVKELHPLPEGEQSIPTRMLENGRVLGASFDEGGTWYGSSRPTVWMDTVPHALRLPRDATLGVAHDGNGQGQVVGFAWMSEAGGHRPMLWIHGVLTRLAVPPGASFARAFAINDSGFIVGCAGPQSTFLLQPAIWTSPATGLVLELPPGNFGGELRDVNGVGTAVGYAHLGGYRPILYDAQGLRVLALPPGLTDGVLLAINREGLAVGQGVSGSPGIGQAFLAQGERIVLLEDLLDPVTGAGWKIAELYCVNNLGQLAAFGTRTTATYEKAILLLEPMP